MAELKIEEVIQSTGFCAKEEIENISVMKSGMTNRSYSFYVKGKRYIVRIPGEGTELLINRRQEYDVYQKIKPLDISEEAHYFDPVTGIKIASYLYHAHPCNAEDFHQVSDCMRQLRQFHSRKLTVGHDFDLWGQIDYYESLLGGQASCYPDYLQTKQAVFELRDYIRSQNCDRVLCHIDSVPDNFMFETNDDGSIRIRLIDWEYAGMQDPHLDIAMFAIYAMYDREKVDRLIDLYFTEGCPNPIRMKIYCYIAISGLLWSNWCEFKRLCGVEFGEYAQRQYDYAKEYTEYFHQEYLTACGKAFNQSLCNV